MLNLQIPFQKLRILTREEKLFLLFLEKYFVVVGFQQIMALPLSFIVKCFIFLLYALDKETPKKLLNALLVMCKY